ncbi:MAG: mechanosensitive ion channel family protein [Bowdeniella nasicola]|nr:mechanosensitive ion channel family protein [Bowdeniella nasicola]
MHPADPTSPTDTAEKAAEAAVDLLALLGFAGIGLLIALGVAVVIGVSVRILARRRPVLSALSKHARRPFNVGLLALGAWLGVLIPTTSAAGDRWRLLFNHLSVLVLIGIAAWFLIALLNAVEDMVITHHEEIATPSYLARIRTQTQVLRRVGSAIIVVCAIAGMLLTFDGARAVGASVFASAGVISIVAGLAAQSTLGNVFAGMQIAFSDAIRVDDLCSIDGQLATIEEITLTYVVARTWDDRRIILPSTRFANEPFENWTRRESKLLGTVEIDVDWLVPVEAVRAQLHRIVNASDLWDGRSCGMQVTDATDGAVRVRAVVSAANNGNLWDLRCEVREQLVDWLQAHAPYALPRTRVETDPFQAPSLEERRGLNTEMRDRLQAELKERATRREDTLDEIAAVQLSDEEIEMRRRRQAAARRARRQAERADRRAAKQDLRRFANRRFKTPAPSTDDTRVMTEADLRELENQLASDRLYSGSKEADERAKLMTGPSKEVMATREEAANRRRHNRDEDAGADGGCKPANAPDETPAGAAGADGGERSDDSETQNGQSPESKEER